jgi:hypothetical protein
MGKASIGSHLPARRGILPHLCPSPFPPGGLWDQQAHGMCNELTTSRLCRMGSYSKPFHHYCQLAVSFLELGPRQMRAIRYRQAQSQFTKETISLRIP